MKQITQYFLEGESPTLIKWICPETVSGQLITHLACDQVDGVIYRLLLSSTITGASFNLIPYVEVKITGGVTIISNNNLHALTYYWI